MELCSDIKEVEAGLKSLEKSNAHAGLLCLLASLQESSLRGPLQAIMDNMSISSPLSMPHCNLQPCILEATDSHCSASQHVIGVCHKPCVSVLCISIHLDLICLNKTVIHGLVM